MAWQSQLCIDPTASIPFASPAHPHYTLRANPYTTMLACSTFLLTALVALTHAVPFPSETNPSAGAGTPTQLAVWQRQDKNYFDKQPANGGSAIAYFVDVDAFPTKYGGLVPITFTDGGVPCTHTLTAVVAEQTSTSSASGGAVVTVTDASE